MGKVIPFKSQDDHRIEKESRVMLQIADEIDAVLVKHLGDGMDPRDLAGLVAHRLGTLMRHVQGKEREVLWLVVQKVLRQQSEVDRVSDL